MKISMLWLGTLLLLASGCMTQANQQTDALKLVGQIHASVQTGDWDVALTLYDDTFFAGRDKAAWRDKLAGIPARFGKLLKIKQSFAQKDPRFSGEFYVYGFKLFFEKGVLNETLTVFKGVNAERMTVTGHLFKHKDRVW